MNKISIIKTEEVQLPQVSLHSSPMLEILTSALGVNRDILPSDEQISHAWSNLPRLLSRISPELRSEGLVRMCIAVASGLFDSGINYAWNAAIIELREKVRRFGIHIIPQIIDRDFDEKKLLEQQDSELLTLCLKLNLISEHGYFMLNQCRDIRNNFSSAHPTIGKLDEDEFVGFVNRIGRYALNNEKNPQAVDVKDLINAVSLGSFSQEQYAIWSERISKTFEAQRETIIGMLHGIYCDPNKSEEARINSITICSLIKDTISPNIASLIINRHQDYLAKGDSGRHKASQAFFENLGLIELLSESEKHAIISSASKRLLSVHNAFNNFYNESPFAERLRSLVTNNAVPPTAQLEFVETVVTCSVGNAWGTSSLADIEYIHIVQGFSPREIQIMLELPDTKTVVSERIKSNSRCKIKYANLVSFLKPESIPTQSKSVYEKWIKFNQEQV